MGGTYRLGPEPGCPCAGGGACCACIDLGGAYGPGWGSPVGATWLVGGGAYGPDGGAVDGGII